jgi:hypothetical protein
MYIVKILIKINKNVKKTKEESFKRGGRTLAHGIEHLGNTRLAATIFTLKTRWS